MQQQQPVLMQAQPVMMGAAPGIQSVPAAVPAAVGLTMAPAPGVGVNGFPVVSGNIPPPEISGFGKTASEVAAEHAQFAYANGVFEPQDFKPADDDPSRFYPVREVDGNWTQRSRMTIDNLGDCRWFITPEGYFYAVRLAN
jgi:hypothetical protein